jgi:6-phosphofructo-2-kinase/fructose-2,6-biphosphatase 4
MACDAMHIPKLKFPRNEIIEVSRMLLSSFSNYQADNVQIIPASYQNEAKRIHIPGLNPELVPGSPEDIKIPVPPSGVVSPMSGLGTPAEPSNTPSLRVVSPTEEHPLSRD